MINNISLTLREQRPKRIVHVIQTDFAVEMFKGTGLLIPMAACFKVGIVVSHVVL
jgi:hypothetical protein